MHQHSGPATVQLVPDERSDEEGEAAPPLPGFVPQLVYKAPLGRPAHRDRTGQRRRAASSLALLLRLAGVATHAAAPHPPALPPQRSSSQQTFLGGPQEAGFCSPAPEPAPFLSPRQVATAPLVERIGSKGQAAVVPNALRRSARCTPCGGTSSTTPGVAAEPGESRERRRERESE